MKDSILEEFTDKEMILELKEWLSKQEEFPLWSVISPQFTYSFTNSSIGWLCSITNNKTKEKFNFTSRNL